MGQRWQCCNRKHLIGQLVWPTSIYSHSSWRRRWSTSTCSSPMTMSCLSANGCWTRRLILYRSSTLTHGSMTEPHSRSQCWFKGFTRKIHHQHPGIRCKYVAHTACNNQSTFPSLLYVNRSLYFSMRVFYVCRRTSVCVCVICSAHLLRAKAELISDAAIQLTAIYFRINFWVFNKNLPLNISLL